LERAVDTDRRQSIVARFTRRRRLDRITLIEGGRSRAGSKASAKTWEEDARWVAFTRFTAERYATERGCVSRRRICSILGYRSNKERRNERVM